MKQTQLHVFTIRRLDPSRRMQAGNVEILLDGRPLEGVQAITFEMDCDKLPRVKLEMIVGGADIEADVEMEKET